MEGDAFFGTISPSFAVLAEGFEGEGRVRLRELAAEFWARAGLKTSSRAWCAIMTPPVRVRNCAGLRSLTEALDEPVSVVFENNPDHCIEAVAAPAQAVRWEIDGAGGSLLPGHVRDARASGRDGQPSSTCGGCHQRARYGQ